MTDYSALLRELAVPRLVGTRNHTRVPDILKRELTARGFVVDEHAFTGRPSRFLLGVPTLVRGLNLIARRPGTDLRPSVWLAAHYDSKGQPISMATRLVGAAAATLGAAWLLAAAVAAWTLAPAIVLVVLGGIVLSRNRVTDGSPGAVDNASGVLALLATVDRLPRDAPIGIILPDAEEFGLVGASTVARERPELLRDTAVVNFDGIDDQGRVIALVHRPGAVVDAVVGSLGAAVWRRLPVVVDGIALARAARECVTVMRGDWRTARVVHTPRDKAERLTLEGVRQVAEGVATALQTL